MVDVVGLGGNRQRPEIFPGRNSPCRFHTFAQMIMRGLRPDKPVPLVLGRPWSGDIDEELSPQPDDSRREAGVPSSLAQPVNLPSQISPLHGRPSTSGTGL